jgi:lipooligosaccharide transport system ATP-binding protein
MASVLAYAASPALRPDQVPLVVSARGLTKDYGALRAVDGIDFDIAAGESVGFLGPNGAGKSSTMRMIGCVSTPSGGSLRVLGMSASADGRKVRARLGVVPQDDTLDLELTVAENLYVYGRYFGLPRALIRQRSRELLAFVQLGDRASASVDALSGGMRRRLTIARSLINQPDVLLLDEPTTGLDPQARHVLWERLFQLKHRGVTLVLTTHYMDEAEQLCDRLMVMDGGRIIAHGTPHDLVAAHSSREVVELRFVGAVPTDVAQRVAGIGERVEVLADRVLLYTDDGDAALAAVGSRAVSPDSALVRRGSLEDVFLRLTGRTLVD